VPLTRELLRVIYNLILITITSLFDQEKAAVEVYEYISNLAWKMKGVMEDED